MKPRPSQQVQAFEEAHESPVDDVVASTATALNETEIANGEFVNSRAGNANKEREHAVTKLLTAAETFTELCSNSQEAEGFYSKIEGMAKKLNQKVTDFCDSRRSEKKELLATISAEALREPAVPPGGDASWTQPPPQSGAYGQGSAPPPSGPPYTGGGGDSGHSYGQTQGNPYGGAASGPPSYGGSSGAPPYTGSGSGGYQNPYSGSPYQPAPAATSGQPYNPSGQPYNPSGYQPSYGGHSDPYAAQPPPSQQYQPPPSQQYQPPPSQQYQPPPSQQYQPVAGSRGYGMPAQPGLEQLQEMFPGLPRQQLEDVLTRQGGDVQRAINECLSLT